MIVSGGENVVPAEVEEVLLRHPEVADAAVVGREDPEWQQAVTAVVVLASGSEATPDELRRHCAESLAGFKVPKRVELAAALPRTPSGKLMRQGAPVACRGHANRRHLLRQGRRPLASSRARPSRSSATAPRATPTPST